MPKQQREGTLSRFLKLVASAVFLGVLALLTFVSEVAVPAAKYVAEWLHPTAANASTPTRDADEIPLPDPVKMLQVQDQSGWIDAILQITGSIVSSMSVDMSFVQNVIRLEAARVQHLHFLEQHKFMADVSGFQNKVELFRKTRGGSDRSEMKAAGEMLTRKLGAFRAALWTDLPRKVRPGQPKS